MKIIFGIMLSLSSLQYLSANTLPESNLIEISEDKVLQTYSIPSVVAFPNDHFFNLTNRINHFRFTPIDEDENQRLFNTLTKNPRARMKKAGGSCATRRAYVQSLLRNRKIETGRLLIQCPANNGRLRLRDQVTKRYFIFSNFHDASIFLVNTPSGLDFRVMDIQFQSRPESLQEYLGNIEQRQRIKPLKNRGREKGYCYWSINTRYSSY